MRFLAWETLTPSTEIRTPQDKKMERFRENRMSLERRSFRCPRDLLSQKSLNMKLRFLPLEEKETEQKKHYTRGETTRNEHHIFLKVNYSIFL